MVCWSGGRHRIRIIIYLQALRRLVHRVWVETAGHQTGGSVHLVMAPVKVRPGRPHLTDGGEGGGGAPSVRVGAALVRGHDLRLLETPERGVERAEVVPHDERHGLQVMSIPLTQRTSNIMKRRSAPFPTLNLSPMTVGSVMPVWTLWRVRLEGTRSHSP